MIDYATLDTISERLEAYRGDGKSLVLFDDRDHYNYMGREVIRGTFPMLKRADPTGLAMGMLLNEMLEATIDGSQVKLSKLLRQKGFLAELGAILRIKADLDAMVLAPTVQFQDRIERLIGKVSADFGRPTTREIACCLRDAIYSMDRGLTIRWVRFDEVGSNEPVGLHEKIVECATVADFVESLKGSLPFGAYLAKIGHSNTAIGIKKPGRIAYLSSISIDSYSGQMMQRSDNEGHMRDKLDLQSPYERFPKWRNLSFKEDRYIDVGDTGVVSIADLDRDVLIWLAMVIELAGQKMAEVEPGLIRLSETVKLASADAEQVAKLPVLYRPNWTLHKPSLDSMLALLGFNEPWMAGFFAEALVGMTADTFLPMGETQLGFCPQTRTYVRWPGELDKEYNFIERKEILKGRYCFTAVSHGIAGTEEEIDDAIKTIFARNLAQYLLTWGNEKFEILWKRDKPWFMKRIQKNLAKAIDLESTQIFSTYDKAQTGQTISSLYTQSPKRQSFSPLCVFDGRSEVNAVARVAPQNAEELRQLMGLKSVNNLPDYLKLWSRDHDWMTSENQYGAPFMIKGRWMFADRKKGTPSTVLSALICFNTMNHNITKSLAD
jgi:hypothetical protein